ncbi:ABC transporter ATP-binding protein [Paenibacillus doosanensis]|nr:ABC transporter ATP-binding protein [Paenibacillus doosanensis]
MSVLAARSLRLSYEGKTVIDKLDLAFTEGRIHAVIGPNGCGKSTLLKALARQLKPDDGAVLLDGKQLYRMGGKAAARQLGLLAQTQESAAEWTVQQLAAFGRYPHRTFMQGETDEDREIVEWAIDAAGMRPLAHRPLGQLSGGERQRAWIAMALAQRPRVLLLDEPTTFLDIRHQIEIMELVRQMNRTLPITVVMVLHDMHHAARYSDELIVMSAGKIYAQGSPAEVLTPRMLGDVFGVDASVIADVETGKPLIVTRGLIHSRERQEEEEKR